MDYSEENVLGLGLSMISYIDGILEDFPETITRTSPTPAAEYLFNVREEGQKSLSKDMVMVFHRTYRGATLVPLYESKKGHSDRVSVSDYSSQGTR